MRCLAIAACLLVACASSVGANTTDAATTDVVTADGSGEPCEAGALEACLCPDG